MSGVYDFEVESPLPVYEEPATHRLRRTAAVVLASGALLAVSLLAMEDQESPESPTVDTTVVDTPSTDPPEETVLSRDIIINTNPGPNLEGAVTDCIDSFPETSSDWIDGLPYSSAMVPPDFSDGTDTLFFGEAFARESTYKFAVSDGWAVRYDRDEETYGIYRFRMRPSTKPNQPNKLAGELVDTLTGADIERGVTYSDGTLRFSGWRVMDEIIPGDETLYQFALDCEVRIQEVNPPVSPL